MNFGEEISPVCAPQCNREGGGECDVLKKSEKNLN